MARMGGVGGSGRALRKGWRGRLPAKLAAAGGPASGSWSCAPSRAPKRVRTSEAKSVVVAPYSERAQCAVVLSVGTGCAQTAPRAELSAALWVAEGSTGQLPVVSHGLRARFLRGWRWTPRCRPSWKGPTRSGCWRGPRKCIGFLPTRTPPAAALGRSTGH